MPKTIFCLMGPTASGKTDLALALQSSLPLEIISVDSAMIYRDMDIGTAKPDKKTLSLIPHHLIDILNPNESYSAALFCRDAKNKCEAIWQKGKIPLLVGGTMMYFKALQAGLAVLPAANEDIRKEIIKEANELGWAAMHHKLSQVDAASSVKIHPNDTQRLQRALEVYRISGKPLSSLLRETKNDHEFVNIILMPKERSWLHHRIARRFEEMLNHGFIEEVEALQMKWHLSGLEPSMRTVGYRQIFDYLKGKSDKEEMMAKASAATRQLAKRQLTWLRTWPNAHFLNVDDMHQGRESIAILRQMIDNLSL